MRTRTLLLLAVACGLVILAAGVVQLLRIAGQDEPERAARIGEEVQVGDLAVTVEDFAEDGGRAVVELELGGVDDPDGTDDFRLVVPGALLAPIDDECAGATVPLRACSLTFDLSGTEGSSRVLIYRRGDERALGAHRAAVIWAGSVPTGGTIPAQMPVWHESRPDGRSRCANRTALPCPGRWRPTPRRVIPTAEQFDLVFIGGGPGGYAGALYAASAGVKVALVEMDALGGTCLNRGCIPAKAFLETAAVHRHVQHAADFGIDAGSPTVNFAVTQARKQKIVAGLVGGIAAMCKARKVEVFNGVGSLGADHVVSVAGADGSTTEITGANVVLAAGSVPRLIPNFERGGPIMTSDEVLDLDHLPARVAVIGGGAIGCEFASTFADLGVRVTILEALPKILPGLDADVANVVVRSFKQKQIDIRTGVMVNGHSPNDSGGTTVHFGESEDLEVDVVVVSVGRRPFADQLGLDGTGVKVDERGFVVVDEFCRTGEDGVYAIGDLIDTPQLAHVGYAEAILVVKQTLGETAMPVMYDRVPWAIYCHPEVAWAGPGEEEAKAAGHDVVVAKHPFKFNSRAQILGELDGLAKIIAEKGPDGRAGRILGVHMVGPWVTEQLSGGYLAVNWDATVDEVAEFIQPHPSLTELFGETVLTLTGRNFNG